MDCRGTRRRLRARGAAMALNEADIAGLCETFRIRAETYMRMVTTTRATNTNADRAHRYRAGARLVAQGLLRCFAVTDTAPERPWVAHRGSEQSGSPRRQARNAPIAYELAFWRATWKASLKRVNRFRSNPRSSMEKLASVFSSRPAFNSIALVMTLLPFSVIVASMRRRSC
jgi:hypothetical protein